MMLRLNDKYIDVEALEAQKGQNECVPNSNCSKKDFLIEICREAWNEKIVQIEVE